MSVAPSRPTTVADGDRPSGRPWPSAPSLAVLAVALVAVLPVLTVVVVHAFRAWTPVQDFAVIDLRVRDVWSRDVPLTGAYSRMGWNHPGPAMYWLIAVLSLAVGKAAWATLVGAALLQGLATAWLVGLAYRRAGLAWALFWTAVLVLSYSATGGWILLQPWNPHVAFPFYVLFLLYAWLVADGQRALVPGGVIVASFLVQTHVGYVPLVVAVGLPAWLASRRTGRDSPPARWRRPAAILAVGWFPVVLDCVLDPPGNITRAARYFVDGAGGQPAVGLASAARLYAAEFRWPPPWLGGRDGPDPLTGLGRPASAGWLVVPAFLLLAGWLVARRSGNRAGVRLVAFAALVSVVSVLTLSRVEGEAFPYLFYWRIPAAVLAVAAPVWAVATSLRSTRFGRVPWLAAAGLGPLVVAVVLGSAGLTHAVAPPSAADGPIAPVVRAFGAELARPRPVGPVLVRYAGSPLMGLEGGLIDQLDRDGMVVRVDRDRRRQFGRHRAADPRDVRQVWYVAEQGYVASLLTAYPDARLLARTTALPAPLDRRAAGLQRRLAAQLRRVGAAAPEAVEALDSPLIGWATRDMPVDHAAADQLGRLNQLAAEGGICRCAVVAFPPNRLPELRGLFPAAG